MKVFQINTVYNTGSTGRIVADLKHILEENNHECFVAFGRGKSTECNTECISNKIDLCHHALMTRLTDRTGFYSKKATKKLINRIIEFQPDIVHLHNIHGYYVNINMLFDFLRKYDKPVIWTLHDCWSFTGHCVHFDAAGCEKWKNECGNCINSGEYPKTVRDNSKSNYKMKKVIFNLLEKKVLITPSKWLAEKCKSSFLGKYEIQVINNGLDINIFKPTPSNIRAKYGIENKKIVLGVANVWNKNKGLNDFITLSQQLPDEYVVFIVGLNAKQIKLLPSNVIGIGRTENIQQLVELYSTADVYFNSSVEETMGLTTIEALVCGTPVITYNKTAVPEFVPQNDGIVVESNNIQAVLTAIDTLANRKSDVNYKHYAELYDKYKKYDQYLSLYEQMLDY